MADEMSEVCWRIAGWNERFENAQSRLCEKVSWVPMPNGHDGLGYKRIASRPDACEVFTAWVLMVQIASRLPMRGVLADNGMALSTEDMALRTSFPKSIFDKALKVLSEPKVGWIECSAMSALIADYERAIQNRIELNRTDKTRITFDVSTGKLDGITADQLQRWTSAYPACDVDLEIKKAEEWLVMNPTKARKKHYGRFMTNWLSRKQERGGDRTPRLMAAGGGKSIWD